MKQPQQEWPDWLPDLLEINGNPFQVFDDLYAVFQRDLINAHPQFRGCPVWHNRRILQDEDKEEGFWHLVTRQNYGAGERQLDSRRAERLAWCAAILNHENDPQLKA